MKNKILFTTVIFVAVLTIITFAHRSRLIGKKSIYRKIEVGQIWKLESDTNITLKFEKNILKFYTPCKVYSDKYAIKKNSISIWAPISEKKYCPKEDRYYWDILFTAHHFKIKRKNKKESKLIFICKRDKKLIFTNGKK